MFKHYGIIIIDGKKKKMMYFHTPQMTQTGNSPWLSHRTRIRVLTSIIGKTNKQLGYTGTMRQE